MDELGNWVYIILMAVVGISSFISSVNKKKRQQQANFPVPQPAEPSFPMPSFPAPPVPRRKEVKAPPPMRKKLHNPPVVSQFTDPDDDISVGEITSAAPVEEIPIINTLKLNNTDDIRKAFIYAEIINRKYV
ncbi:MAG: hypothetical protein LBE56_03400 [Tannerella sp.]|jgi:hypothetical protein|nr:hypothetical protein [Tannerella sp.]